jgi:hypothetical protein
MIERATRIMTVDDCAYGNYIYIYDDNEFRFDIDCLCKACENAQMEVIQ